MDILNLKAWEMKEKLINKEISSREIIISHLDRIKEVEEDSNTFLSINKEKALIASDIVDRKIKDNTPIGILEGIPIGIKDNIVTKDFVTSGGSKMLEGFVSPYDATVVERIKKAGGIILGKTNMDEFGIGAGALETSATAVAAKEVALALGTDTGGSIRESANYSNVVGIKPSYGMVSRYGLISLANTFEQIGTIGRDVRDAALLLSAIYGYDEKDLTTSNMKSKNLDLNMEKSIDYLKGKRIGLPKELFELEIEDKVRKTINKSINLFKDAGAIIEEVSIPSLKYALETYQILTSAEISSNLARFDGIQYGFRANEYNDLDELYMNTRSEGFTNETKRRILLGTYILSGSMREKYYEKAIRLRTLIINDFKRAFKDVDILLTPTSPVSSTELEVGTIFTTPVNIAGLCAITLPAIITDNLSPGLQLIGDRYKDDEIIKIALAYEGLVK